MSQRKSPSRESAGNDIGQPGAADAMFTVSAVAAGPGISWVSAAGKLAGDFAATRLAAVLQHQRATGCYFVRLDLSELLMLDRAGFDVLVDAHHQFVAAGGALVMTGVGFRIARLFQLTRMNRTLFTIARASDLPPAGVDPAVVDRAVGVLMGRAHCDVSEATDQLMTLARATSCTLGVAAQSILDEYARPTEHRPHTRGPQALPNGPPRGRSRLRLERGQEPWYMPYPSPEPHSSVPDLMAELARVRAAIRRTRRSTSPGADQATAQELLVLYARECAVVRRLRRRHRQWRAETGISDATPRRNDAVREPS